MVTMLCIYRQLTIIEKLICLKYYTLPVLATCVFLIIRVYSKLIFFKVPWFLKILYFKIRSFTWNLYGDHLKCFITQILDEYLTTVREYSSSRAINSMILLNSTVLVESNWRYFEYWQARRLCEYHTRFLWTHSQSSLRLSEISAFIKISKSKSSILIIILKVLN